MDLQKGLFVIYMEIDFSHNAISNVKFILKISKTIYVTVNLSFIYKSLPYKRTKKLTVSDKEGHLADPLSFSSG